MTANNRTSLTVSQLDGLACVRCKRSFLEPESISSPADRTESGGQLFVCSGGFGCSGIDVTAPDVVDVRCGDCGKHLPGWRYKPMFVQCLDCAEVADTMPADTARLVATVHQRLRDAFAQSGRTAPEVEKLTGIAHERVSALIDGRDTATVSELLLLGLALGSNAADWFRVEAVDQ